MNNLVEEKAKEMAAKHAAIIEQQCILACEKFNCLAEDLIIEYHGHLDIMINVKASHFRITNIFTYESDQIRNDSQIFEDINK